MESFGSTKETPHIFKGKISSHTLFFDKWKAKGSTMDMEQVKHSCTKITFVLFV